MPKPERKPTFRPWERLIIAGLLIVMVVWLAVWVGGIANTGLFGGRGMGTPFTAEERQRAR
jgi:hypothetical protein